MSKRRPQPQSSADGPKANVLKLAPEGNHAANRVCGRYAMKKGEMASRVMLWLDRAPEPLQHCVLAIAAPQMTEEYLRHVTDYFRLCAAGMGPGVDADRDPTSGEAAAGPGAGPSPAPHPPGRPRRPGGTPR